MSKWRVIKNVLLAIFLVIFTAGCGAAKPVVRPVSITSKGNSGYALKSDGTVCAWGENGCGQLGNNSTTDSYVPVQVPGLTDITAIFAGDYSGYALKSDGTAWAWGNNQNGELGNGSTVDGHIPVQIPGLSGVTAIAAGVSSDYALKSDGTVWAWGSNFSYELGNTLPTDNHIPVQVSSLTGVTAIAAGNGTGYALKSDGTVWAWGDNEKGTLGNGTNSAYSSIPVQVSNLSGVKTIAASESSGYALKSDGTVWAWGSNYSGELGDDATTDSDLPVQVYDLDLTDVTAIAAGNGTGYALKSDGTVWAWGNTLPTESYIPVQVSGLNGVTAIAGGNGTGYALKSNGTVWAWGFNQSGKLGNGSDININGYVPVKVLLP